MSRIRFLAAALLATPALATAPAPPPAPAAPGVPQTAFSLEHRMLLRCAAAFALVAHQQETGDRAALAFPPLQKRGREFFVRASARIMDEAGLDRTSIAAALTQEARQLMGGEGVAPVMPACLAALEAAGL